MPQQWTAEEIRTFLETHQAEGWIPAEKRPGRVVCVEGMDGVGKSTATRELIKRLYRSGMMSFGTHSRYFRVLAGQRKRIVSLLGRHREEDEQPAMQFSYRLNEYEELAQLVQIWPKEIPAIVFLDRGFLTSIADFLYDEIVNNRLENSAKVVWQFIGCEILPQIDGCYIIPDTTLVCIDSTDGIVWRRREREERSSDDLRTEVDCQRRVWSWIAEICPQSKVVDVECPTKPRLPLFYQIWDIIELYRQATGIAFDERFPSYSVWRRERARNEAIQVAVERYMIPFIGGVVAELAPGRGELVHSDLQDDPDLDSYIKQHEQWVRIQVEREFGGRTF